MKETSWHDNNSLRFQNSPNYVHQKVILYPLGWGFHDVVQRPRHSDVFQLLCSAQSNHETPVFSGNIKSIVARFPLTPSLLRSMTVQAELDTMLLTGRETFEDWLTTVVQRSANLKTQQMSVSLACGYLGPHQWDYRHVAALNPVHRCYGYPGSLGFSK